MALKKGGFQLASSEIIPRLISSVDGLEGCGKNHFAFTAPGPMAVISLDTGLEGVVQKFQKDKEIMVAEYDMPITFGMNTQQISTLAQKLWTGIKTDYLDALATKEIRTIICDTGSEMWEACRLAWFGKLTEVLPHHYTKPNGEWRDLVRLAYAEKKQVIFLHKMKDEYKGKDKTGDFKRSGMSDMGFLVQVAGTNWKDPRESSVPDKFHHTITKCRFNTELEGLDFAGEECNFPNVASWVLFGDGEHTGEFE